MTSLLQIKNARSLLVATVFTIAACGSQGADLADARIGPEFDASATDASVTTTDSKVLDGATTNADAHVQSDDARTGMVSVTVLDPVTSSPISATAVLFENPDGSLNSQLTDQAGQASALITAGASVTVVIENNATDVTEDTVNDDIQSILNVQPGDALTFSPVGIPADAQLQYGETMFLNIPQYDTVSNVIFTTACFGGAWNGNPGSTSGGVPIPEGCTNGHYAAMPMDRVTGDVEAYLVTADQPVDPNAANQQLTVDGPWLTAPATTLTFNNLPSPAVVSGFSLWLYNDAADFFNFSINEPTTFQSTVATTFHIPPIGQNRTFMTIGLTDQMGAYQSVFMNPPTSDLALDGSATLLPWVVASSTYDSATRNVAWTQSGGGTADATMEQFFYTTPSGNASWMVLAPVGQSSVKLPHLSASLAALQPPTIAVDDKVNGVVSTLFASRPSVSYDTLRAEAPFAIMYNRERSMPSWFTGFFVTASR